MRLTQSRPRNKPDFFEGHNKISVFSTESSKRVYRAYFTIRGPHPKNFLNRTNIAYNLMVRHPVAIHQHTNKDNCLHLKLFSATFH